jgi:hypothetical protein
MAKTRFPIYPLAMSRVLFAALLLALAPRAFPAVVGVEPLYPAVAAPWSGAIGGALNVSAGAPALSPSLAPLSSAGLAPGAGYAPVVAQLEGALKLSPAAFAALAPAEKHAALELAVEAAQSDLTQKTYELSSRARALSAPDKPLDKSGRAELYRVVAQLDEMRTRYGPLLSEQESASVANAYASAAGRAWEIRNNLMGARMREMGAALTGPAFEAAAAPAAVLPAPATSGTRALADDMRRNPVGWKLKDLDRLLKGYGFTLDEGGKHRKYEFPGMKPEIVPRHNEVDPNYIRSALAAADRIDALRVAPAAPVERAAAPAQIDLADLAVLLSEEAKKPAAKPAPRAAPVKTAAAPVAPSAPRNVPPEAVKLVPAQPRAAEEARPEPPAVATVAEEEAPARGATARLKDWLKNAFGPN